MNPSIRDKFDKINGVCDYFYVLEKENEDIQHKMMGEMHKDFGDETKSQLHNLPRGYPQKHLYKVPQICKECIQIEVPQDQYKGAKENFTKQNDEASLMVYQNQQRDLPNPQISKRMKTKRSNSVEVQTLKFKDNRERSSDVIDFQSLAQNNSGKRMKNIYNMDQTLKTRKIQRRDQLKTPIGLNQEPKINFVADQNGGQKYDSAQLDEYLGFCDFFMREAPIQGGYCGIWLRGSNMYKENAFKLLNEYNYNFDLAKFHILFPQVMSDPSSKFQMIQISKTHPQDLAKEVANAIIDLQGCKQDEINEILGKFRQDLSRRINDEQLRYHLTILQKKKIQTPDDIEKMIKASNDFSREIKKKCNIQSGNNKTSQRVPNDKKLKMSELLELYEQQKTFQYITAEMIILEQQLQRAKNWQSKVESIRDQEVHQRVIDQIHDDGKNIPVNFQELMEELKLRKMHVEDINKKIKEAITVQKTRAGMRAPEGKGRSKKVAQETKEDKQDGLDKEQQLRDLKDQAQKMKLQSDQISKLVKTLGEIDKWKQEVNVVFKNEEIEKQNYKRYKEQYKGLIVRSSVFQIDLQILKQVRLKLALIDWRDQVEDIMDQLKTGSKVTLDQIYLTLEEGREKNFIQKIDGKFVRIDMYAKSPLTNTNQFPEANKSETLDKISNDLQPLFFTFNSLTDIIEQYQNSQKYEKYLQKILNRLDNKSSDSSSNGSKCENHISLSLIDMAELQRLDDESSQIKVEVDKIKEFKEKFVHIKKQEQHCQNIINEHIVDGQVVIKSKQTFDVFLKAKKVLQQQNIISNILKNFQTQMQPYICWINKAIKVIKQYYKVLGLKQGQLNLYEPIECSTDAPDPYSSLGDYDAIMALNTTMEQENFKLFQTMDEGKYIQQILKSTNDLKEELEQYKMEKRDPNFDINNYFKFLEHFQNCGLPVKNEILEDVKVELKRERWIKKFNDLQNAGKGLNQLSRQNSLIEKQEVNNSPGKISGSKISNLIQNQNSTYVRIKKVDDLVSEFQTNQDIKDDESCSNLAKKLIDQQQKSTQWLEKFQLLFNAYEQFEPRGGIQQIDDLLKEGELLELKLKEFVDLQVHQKETHEWNKTTSEIFNNSKTVTLDQLKKHKKDTIEITEMANAKFIELLDSLKEIATIWKIFAKAILKIRPIENFQGRMYHQKQINEGKIVLIEQDQQEVFCICRQPENGSYMMICCDFCDMWYHLSCVGLPNDLKLEKIKYKCIGCAMREGKIFDENYFPSTSQIKPSYFKDLSTATELEEQSHSHLSSQPQDQYQIEIENLLLEYFQQKQRIPINTFNYVISEGEHNIPLKLEEMEDLLFIKSQVTAWIDKVKGQLRHGPESYSMLQNFQLINSANISEKDVIRLQQKEKQRDDEIMNLIIEQASFPCVDQVSIISILQLIKYRDWLRECFQVFYFFNPNAQQAAKTNKQNKQSKIKQRKDVKRLIYKGEIIMNMTCELQETQFIKIIKENVTVLNDILQQLIANKATEVNQKPLFFLNLQQSIFDQIEFEQEMKLMAEANHENNQDQEFALDDFQFDKVPLYKRINESQLLTLGGEINNQSLNEQTALQIMQQVPEHLKISIDTSEVAPKNNLVISQKISINLNKDSSEKKVEVQGQPQSWIHHDQEAKLTLPNLNQISQFTATQIQQHQVNQQPPQRSKQMIVINTGEQPKFAPTQPLPTQPLQTHYQLPIMNPVIPQLNSQAKISFDILKKSINQIIEKMKSSILIGDNTQAENPELALYLQQTSEYTDLVQSQGEQFIQHEKNLDLIQRAQQFLQQF